MLPMAVLIPITKRFLSYMLFQHPPQFEKPTALQFPMNDICNSKCRMCNIWSNKNDTSISPSELRILLRDEAFSELDTVGLSGGEPTLREDLDQLCLVLCEELPKLTSISMISNGLDYAQCLEMTKKCADVCNDHGVDFHLMYSLDGYRHFHDEIRRSPGNFETTTRLYSYFKNYSNVTTVSFACTISLRNVDGLYELLFYCIRLNAKIKFRLAIEHKRLYNENIKNAFSLNRLKCLQVAKFLEAVKNGYENGQGQKNIYDNLINFLRANTKRSIPCLWQHRALTLFNDGSVGFCAVKSEKIAKYNKAISIWQQCLKSKEHLDDIIKNSCETCMHDYTGIPNRAELIERLIGIKK